MKRNTLKVWELYTQQLADEFVLKYFDKDADYRWIANEVGGVLFVNDCFFNLKDMVDFIRYKYSKKKMFKYYEYMLDTYETREVRINIKHFK